MAETARTEITLAQAELLSGGERDLVAAMNRTHTDYPRESSLGTLFAEQVAQRPDGPPNVRLHHADLPGTRPGD